MQGRDRSPSRRWHRVRGAGDWGGRGGGERLGGSRRGGGRGVLSAQLRRRRSRSGRSCHSAGSPRRGGRSVALLGGVARSARVRAVLHNRAQRLSAARDRQLPGTAAGRVEPGGVPARDVRDALVGRGDDRRNSLPLPGADARVRTGRRRVRRRACRADARWHGRRRPRRRWDDGKDLVHRGRAPGAYWQPGGVPDRPLFKGQRLAGPTAIDRFAGDRGRRWLYRDGGRDGFHPGRPGLC